MNFKDRVHTNRPPVEGENPLPLNPPMGFPRDADGLPILTHVPVAVQIRAVAADAAGRALFGCGLDRLSDARAQVAIEIGHAVCDAVAAFQNPDSN